LAGNNSPRNIKPIASPESKLETEKGTETARDDDNNRQEINTTAKMNKEQEDTTPVGG
jgi:hypothetical protein